MRGAIRGAGLDAMVEKNAPAGEGVAVRRMRENVMDSLAVVDFGVKKVAALHVICRPGTLKSGPCAWGLAAGDGADEIS